MSESHYVWVLGSDGEPLSTEGPFGPYSLQSAKTYARIAATEGAHDRAVSAGGVDPMAPGFKVIRVYKAGTGEHTVKDARYGANARVPVGSRGALSFSIPDRGWLLAIRGEGGYEPESYEHRAKAESAAQELADRTGKSVELIRVQNHGEDRDIVAEIEPHSQQSGRIGVPYMLSWADTYTGKQRDTKPGRGEAGWTVAHFDSEAEARDFLERLPEESWMPGTERLAKKWGVQPRYYDNRWWGRESKPKAPPKIRPEVRQAMSAAIRGDIEGARRDVSRAPGGMTPAERNAFADAMMLNPSEVDQYQARVEMASGEEPHDPGIPGLSVERSGHYVVLTGSYGAIMDALCDVMGLSVDEAEEYIEPRYENNASAASKHEGTVRFFDQVLTGLITQYDQRESAKEMRRGGRPNLYRLSHLLRAAHEARDRAEAVMHDLDRSDAEAVGFYQEALREAFIYEHGRFALTALNKLDKMMTDWIERGVRPRYPVARSA